MILRYIIKNLCIIPWWQKKLLEGARAKKIQLRDTKGGHVLVSSVDCTLVPGLIPTFKWSIVGWEPGGLDSYC